MNSDDALVEALRAAGHEPIADAVRDRALAGELRAAGHEALARQLEQAGEPAQAPPSPTEPENTTTDPAQAHSQDLAALLQAKTDRQAEVVEQLHGPATHNKEQR